MKFLTSILLPCALILALGTFPTTSIYACGKKSAVCKKEVKEKIAQKKAECKKSCCQKTCSDSQNKKKGCCGDDCQCAVSVLLLADLPKSFPFFNLSMQTVLIQKNIFFYKQFFSKSTIQDIWQPPITRLSI